jgi:F-type H+-transporting ATPase subunit b
MELIPYPVGPLNPKVQDLGYALVLFAFVYVLVARVLPRMNQALEARDDATTGAKDRAGATRARAEDERDKAEALLAEARHDAARIRQHAFEEGTSLIAEARADGQLERDAVLAEGRSRIEAECMAAETELRISVSELASDLASRIVGEPIAAPVEQGH